MMKSLLKTTLFSLLVSFSLAACSDKEMADVNLATTAVQDAGKKTSYDAPTLTGASSTQTSINIKVTAGASGMPAGFSVQWMKAADFAANGNSWLETPSLCNGGFSGNANLSRYNLAAGESVTINIGEFLFDNGASTNCNGALVCGTQYVFRAFAHANSAFTRSGYTGNLTGSTLSCVAAKTCTFSQGYWKTHGPVPVGNNTNTWAVTSLKLGTVSYTDLQLLRIFNTPAQGNGLLALAHQLIAAKLNVAKGADSKVIAPSIVAADALISGKVIPPVGAGYLAPGATSTLITALANYNEGATGPGHCN
ncbi:hypothetical protein [Hymenobacter sp. BT730]|uniref:hypothetical protein n=1 Tax=Hymenobacter sp. BT730 TaxID=3063332 RepID=UPI0026DFF461|nr:hypothetical protein [Hymenobacter sp. BT730]